MGVCSNKKLTDGHLDNTGTGACPLFICIKSKYHCIVNSQLVASCQLGFLILFMLYLNYLFLSQGDFGGVPVN